MLRAAVVHAAVEHRTYVDDVVRVARYPPRPLGLGARGHHDLVGRPLLHEARPHADAVLDGDAQPFALVELVADHVAELGTVGHAGRDAHLTAGLVALLEHGDAMAVARRGDGRLQTRRPGADHHHVLRRGGEVHVAHALRLAAGARVLDAPEPAVETHAADALLVAAQTEADLVGGAFASLRREVGVGDLTAHDADEVAVTLLDGALGLQRVLEPAHAHHRQVDGLAHR